MKTWTVRLGLSLMVIVGFWTNRLPAQELFVVPAVPYAPAHHPPSAPAYAPPYMAPPAKHGVTRVLNQHGMCCGVDPFSPACGNLRYELNFIFGSCRWWMQEPCYPNQPLFGGKHGMR